ncbi:hypothetical protein COO60DRAFT_1526381 [Scenedesmus sp. NREL 46B-D3]|nr:hypothetical protein COO60DRAFT_1526381 [Scenedesmus sp. NREL 46B-D3]
MKPFQQGNNSVLLLLLLQAFFSCTNAVRRRIVRSSAGHSDWSSALEWQQRIEAAGCRQEGSAVCKSPTILCLMGSTAR